MATVIKSLDGSAKMQKAMKDLAGIEARAGWFASSKYPDGTPVAYVAAIHTYGYAAGGIPPRTGLVEMVEAKQTYWALIAQAQAKKVVAGTMTGLQAMDVLGGAAAGDIRKQIISVVSPPLKPATIAARAARAGIRDGKSLGASGEKPLNDTGLLLATITHEVGTPSDGDGSLADENA